MLSLEIKMRKRKKWSAHTVKLFFHQACITFIINFQKMYPSGYLRTVIT